MFCYRKTAFPDAPPKDWNDVLKVSQQPKTGQKYPPRLVLRVGPGNSIVTDFMPILWTFDPDSYSPHKAEFRHPAVAAKAFETLASLTPGQNIGGVSVDDFDLAAYMTAKDGASMSIVWSAWAMTMLKADPNLGDTPKFGPMPGGWNELGAWLLAIPKNVDPGHCWKEAKKLVLYATGGDQIRLAACEGNPPPRKKALRDLLGDFPTFGEQRISLSSARMRPRGRSLRTHWADA